MIRTLAISAVLILLALGKAGNAQAAAPQCGGSGINYFCTQFSGQLAAGAPDSVVDLGPLLTCTPSPSCPNPRNEGRQCGVTWNSPHYYWTAWAMITGATPTPSCDQFWNTSLGIYYSWGYDHSPNSYYAPAWP
jgi:hypothetical protein